MRLNSLDLQLDNIAIHNSNHFSIYKNMNRPGSTSFLLNLNLPLHVHHTIAQTRIMGLPSSVNGIFTNIVNRTNCKICLSKYTETEDLYHILLHCALYDNSRSKDEFKQLEFPLDRNKFYNLFKSLSLENTYKIYNLISTFFAYRAQLLQS